MKLVKHVHDDEHWLLLVVGPKGGAGNDEEAQFFALRNKGPPSPVVVTNAKSCAAAANQCASSPLCVGRCHHLRELLHALAYFYERLGAASKGDRGPRVTKQQDGRDGECGWMDLLLRLVDPREASCFSFSS